MTDERLEKLKNWVDLMLMMASDTINDGEIKTSLVRAKDDVMALITAKQQRVPSEEVSRAIKTLQFEKARAEDWIRESKNYAYTQGASELYKNKVTDIDLAITVLRQKDESERILELSAKLNVIDLVRENLRTSNSLRHAKTDIKILQEEHAALRQMGGWIPVSERLPEEGVLVLGYIGGEYWVMQCVPDSSGNMYWRDLCDYDRHDIREVTHWMPLPEAPEGEKQK